MKHVSLAAVVLAFAATAMAADDPFIGTFQLEVDESKSAGPALAVPVAATLAIYEDGDNLVLAVSAKTADGSILEEKTSLPKTGGALRRIDGGALRYDSVTVTRTDAMTLDMAQMQDGKEAIHLRYALSADGKVLTRTAKGTNPRGQSVDAVFVYERQ